ncbi:hypothetical protein CRENBAI_012283 [Crenichthys baileyi]|uniref:Uncharacterized protein n=1 Tax=Crenichthys baileyi TaxID=28760 RepID=A0AAV9RRQ8_9TELE
MDLGENQVNSQRLGAADERQLVKLDGENDWHQLTPSPTQGEAPMDRKEELEAGEHTTIRMDQRERLEEALDGNPSLETSVGAQPRREQKEEGAPSLQEHSFASVVTAKDCGDMPPEAARIEVNFPHGLEKEAGTASHAFLRVRPDSESYPTASPPLEEPNMLPAKALSLSY